ncbi:MAG TPA: acyltransferase, partial [Ramlibacter sp.]|nr:acyltransferase [Ramlibacter sp.]
RILPALLAAITLTVFVLGPAFTGAPLAQYFSSRETWLYLAKGLTLFDGVAYTLPGVFDANPYPQAVNGSLWTLPYEVRMYALLATLWVVLGVLGARRERLVRGAIVAAAVASGALLLLLHFTSDQPRHFVRLFFMFYSGAALWVLKGRVKLSGRFALFAGVLLAFSTAHRDLFFVVYALLLPYLLMCAAFLPRGWIRRYNAAGDYSYGLYVYAFPIQQAAVALVPGIGPWGLIFASGALTLVSAVASWHLIEQPAMRLRRRRETAGQLSPA